MVERIRFVQLESPFGAPDADGLVRNIAYALSCMRNSLGKGEAPFASHLLYTQMLDDTVPQERHHGIMAGLRIGEGAEITVVYDDLGVSRGMQMGIDHANELQRPVEYRQLYQGLTNTAELHRLILEDSPMSPDVIRMLYARNM